MKTLKEIATIILERRQRTNNTVMQGEMVEVLGESGLKEALNRKWLVPDFDSGYLVTSNHGNAVDEMLATAQMPDPEPESESAYVSESRAICASHAYRSVKEASLLSEIAAPATGKPAPSFVQTAPATPTSAPAQKPGGTSQPLSVGEDVGVVQSGKMFQGKVQSANNGRYRISFGGPDRPADREYSENELSRIPAAQ